MAVPKKKTTRKQRGDRRAHQKLQAVRLMDCPQCSSPKQAHRMCANCGYYKGRQVMEIETAEDKAQRKEDERKGRSSGKRRSGSRPTSPVKEGMKSRPGAQTLSPEELSRPAGDR